MYNRNLYKKVRDTTEYKHIDTVTAGAANNTGRITLLNGLSQGDTSTKRIGSNILMKSISMRLHFYTTTGCPSQAIRYMLVFVKQPQGQAPLQNDIVYNVDRFKKKAPRIDFL